MDDSIIIISPKEPKKSTIVAFILLLPFCFLDRIIEWAGLGSVEPKILSVFVAIAWLLGAVGVVFEAGLRYRIDKNGVTRTLFGKFATFIPWDEMKFIGTCIAPLDFTFLPVNNSRVEMLFSRRPYSEYKNYHTLIHRLRDNRHVISIWYIDDETYEKILEFSGGERNIE